MLLPLSPFSSFNFSLSFRTADADQISFEAPAAAAAVVVAAAAAAAVAEKKEEKRSYSSPRKGRFCTGTIGPERGEVEEVGLGRENLHLTV